MDNYILAGDERQAALEAAKAAFLNQGGEIKVLESFEYKPLPNRNHPDPKPKIPKLLKAISKRESNEKERADMVEELGKTMTCREVSQHTKIPQGTLWSISKKFGFGFASAPRGRTEFVKYDDEKDAALAERIRALQQIGVSRNQATLHLQIGHTTMSRIIKKFGIVFPAGGPRKSK